MEPSSTGEAEAPKMDSKTPQSFNFITWEIDTTGRLLCDEIFHMSAVFNESKMDVYIMPYRDIAFFASRKFQICTSNSGIYRYLRRIQTGKIIQSKTEIFGLEEFLTWLKTHSQLPIVLMCYEPHEFAPFILIQALERYGMLQQFKELVYGFAHAYEFVKKKCKKSMTSLSIRPLAKVLLNRNDIKSFDSLNRAKLVYEILLHLCDGDSTNSADTLASEMQKYVKSVDDLEKDLEVRRKKTELQVSLKPIFSPYLKNSESRRKALNLRGHIIRSNTNYERLKEIWTKGKEVFVEEIKELLNGAGDDVAKEIIALLMHHFESSDVLTNSVSKASPLNITEVLKKLTLD